MQGRILPYIPDSHLYKVTKARCPIGMVFSPYDGHIVAQNMERKAVNILRKFLVLSTKDYTRMHGQQNIKFYSTQPAFALTTLSFTANPGCLFSIQTIFQTVCKSTATSMQNTTDLMHYLHTFNKTGHDSDNPFNMNHHV